MKLYESLLHADPFFLIAGPCVVEDDETMSQIASTLVNLAQRLGLILIFKASYKKANRSSETSYSGPGTQEGLKILSRLKAEFGFPVLTDIHECADAEEAAEVCDILQIPAFLSRQTELIHAAARTGKIINIKKGQFMAPEDMRPAVDKIHTTGNRRVMLTERGASFGYHNLVVDMRSLIQMAEIGCPVIFDATHSVQLPSGQGGVSGGRREFIFPLARAAAAVGIQGLFLEVHPDPDKALSDGPNSLSLKELKPVLKKIKALYELGS